MGEGRRGVNFMPSILVPSAAGDLYQLVIGDVGSKFEPIPIELILTTNEISKLFFTVGPNAPREKKLMARLSRWERDGKKRNALPQYLNMRRGHFLMSVNVKDLLTATAYDNNGDKVGDVNEVFVDDSSGQPTFVDVNHGLFGMGNSLVP